MHQSARYLVAGQLRKMRARLTQARAVKADAPDEKFAADEVVQRHTPGDDVATGAAGRQLDTVITLERFDGFKLDQRNVPAHARIGRECALTVEVPVTFEAAAGNRARGVDGTHWGPGIGG